MGDPLKDLPRLGEKALAPCICCRRPMLECMPIFYRVQVKQCGIDMNEVRRHVGLAQSIAPGAEGLALASVLGPRVEPVVVMHDGPELNVCGVCAMRPDYLMLAELALRDPEDGEPR